MDLEEARNRLEEERGRLLDARSDLESDVKQEAAGGEDLSELSSVDQHPADQATETFEREKDLSILESTDEQLRDICLPFYIIPFVFRYYVICTGLRIKFR